jgi:hypothetical protein
MQREALCHMAAAHERDHRDGSAVYLQDAMIEGPFFRFMQHDHAFRTLSSEMTEMEDTFRFTAHCWSFGASWVQVPQSPSVRMNDLAPAAASPHRADARSCPEVPRMIRQWEYSR